MKNYAFLVASAVVCASAAFADNVQGDNVFGVFPVESGTEYTIVAVPWCECSTNNNQAIAVSNIVKTANLEAGDKAFVVDGTGKYNAWQLVDRGGVLYWDSISTVTLDGIGSIDANIATAARGSAIIIYRKNPKEGSVAKKFYLFGQVGTESTVATTIVAGNTALVAPPYYAADGVDILDNEKVTFIPNDGDKILVRKAASGASREYTHKSSKWYYKNPANDFEETEATSIIIPCGLGAWYEAKGNVTITWNGVPTK